ncbi:probable receptor-like protein kinase At4g39110 [Rutidosis leptorrhynchoides]|uniref:probable receptor-like protein kinase At4g39110 n=1 Tax=Rutidosis leptorrhynchoides TaxID=125765 RepID=UPI003A99FD38
MRQGPECRVLRLKDIRRATNEFAIDNLISEGTFWKSYHGYFSRGRFKGNFLVKRINKELAADVESYMFKLEVKDLADCNRHINIISLLGYCVEKNENIMVYRLRSNGLLYDYLYNDQHNAPRLTELQRLDVCLGVAHGLSYLHMKDILHGNLTANNIFLDHNMVPRISDMDLAFGIHHIHGTEGYPAPECYEPGYKPTKQADVYAFGILLLEVLCEKPSWKCLVMLALEFAVKRELPRSGGHELVEVSLSEECLRACDKRPSMNQVVGELELALKLQMDYENGKANSQQVGCQLYH